MIQKLYIRLRLFLRLPLSPAQAFILYSHGIQKINRKEIKRLIYENGTGNFRFKPVIESKMTQLHRDLKLIK